jgi:hypothetical protein
MYGISVDIKRVSKRLWTGQKQPKLGSSYDPELAIALEGLEAGDIKNDTSGAIPSPAE